VMVLAGTYVQTGNVDLYDNINLVGQDRTDSIVDFNNTSGSLRTIGTAETRKKDVHIKNLTIKNSYDNTEGAVYFYYADHCSVENCYFTGNWDSGNTRGREIKANYARYLTITRNRFDATAGEVYILGFSGGTVVSFNTWGTIYDTALNQYASDVTVIGNFIIDCEAEWAIWAEGCDYSSFIGNMINPGTVGGVTFWGATICRFIGNQMEGSGDENYGLRLDNNCQGIAVANNNIDCFKLASIFVDDTDFCTFNGNSTVGGLGDGILINDVGCRKNTIVGNYFEEGITDNGTLTTNTGNTEGV